MTVGRGAKQNERALFPTECRALGALGALISRDSRERHTGSESKNPAHALLQNGKFKNDPGVGVVSRVSSTRWQGLNSERRAKTISMRAQHLLSTAR